MDLKSKKENGKRSSRVQVHIRLKECRNEEKAVFNIFTGGTQLHLPATGGRKDVDKWYGFDHVFKTSASNKDVYTLSGYNLVENALKGYNTAIFAYGQQGSGKTRTLMSKDGVAAHMVSHLFNRLSTDITEHRSVSVSYFHIYNEHIYDLLNPYNNVACTIREDKSRGTYVENVTRVHCDSPMDVYDMINVGRKSLIVAETKVNRQSSRSHAVCQLSIEQNMKTSLCKRRFVPGRCSSLPESVMEEDCEMDIFADTQSEQELDLIDTSMFSQEQRRSSSGAVIESELNTFINETSTDNNSPPLIKKSSSLREDSLTSYTNRLVDKKDIFNLSQSKNKQLDNSANGGRNSHFSETPDRRHSDIRPLNELQHTNINKYDEYDNFLSSSQSSIFSSQCSDSPYDYTSDTDCSSCGSSSLFGSDDNSRGKVAKKPFTKNSRISIIDLAGSERIKLAQSDQNTERLREAQNINLSLHELGNVISALASSKRKHVPYRNSVLTRLLQGGLGRKCRITFLLCISTKMGDINETKRTLEFGQKLKPIKPIKILEDVYKRKYEDLTSYWKNIERNKEILPKHRKRNSDSCQDRRTARQILRRSNSLQPNNKYFPCQDSDSEMYTPRSYGDDTISIPDEEEDQQPKRANKIPSLIKKPYTTKEKYNTNYMQSEVSNGIPDNSATADDITTPSNKNNSNNIKPQATTQNLNRYSNPTSIMSKVRLVKYNNFDFQVLEIPDIDIDNSLEALNTSASDDLMYSSFIETESGRMQHGEHLLKIIPGNLNAESISTADLPTYVMVPGDKLPNHKSTNEYNIPISTTSSDIASSPTNLPYEYTNDHVSISSANMTTLMKKIKESSEIYENEIPPKSTIDDSVYNINGIANSNITINGDGHRNQVKEVYHTLPSPPHFLHDTLPNEYSGGPISPVTPSTSMEGLNKPMKAPQGNTDINTQISHVRDSDDDCTTNEVAESKEMDNFLRNERESNNDVDSGSNTLMRTSPIHSESCEDILNNPAGQLEDKNYVNVDNVTRYTNGPDHSIHNPSDVTPDNSASEIGTSSDAHTIPDITNATTDMSIPILDNAVIDYVNKMSNITGSDATFDGLNNTIVDDLTANLPDIEDQICVQLAVDNDESCCEMDIITNEMVAMTDSANDKPVGARDGETTNLTNTPLSDLSNKPLLTSTDNENVMGEKISHIPDDVDDQFADTLNHKPILDMQYESSIVCVSFVEVPDVATNDTITNGFNSDITENTLQVNELVPYEHKTTDVTSINDEVNMFVNNAIPDLSHDHVNKHVTSNSDGKNDFDNSKYGVSDDHNNINEETYDTLDKDIDDISHPLTDANVHYGTINSDDVNGHVRQSSDATNGDVTDTLRNQNDSNDSCQRLVHHNPNENRTNLPLNSTVLIDATDKNSCSITPTTNIESTEASSQPAYEILSSQDAESTESNKHTNVIGDSDNNISCGVCDVVIDNSSVDVSVDVDTDTPSSISQGHVSNHFVVAQETDTSTETETDDITKHVVSDDSYYEIEVAADPINDLEANSIVDKHLNETLSDNKSMYVKDSDIQVTNFPSENTTLEEIPDTVYTNSTCNEDIQDTDGVTSVLNKKRVKDYIDEINNRSKDTTGIKLPTIRNVINKNTTTKTDVVPNKSLDNDTNNIVHNAALNNSDIRDTLAVKEESTAYMENIDNTSNQMSEQHSNTPVTNIVDDHVMEDSLRQTSIPTNMSSLVTVPNSNDIEQYHDEDFKITNEAFANTVQDINLLVDDLNKSFGPTNENLESEALYINGIGDSVKQTSHTIIETSSKTAAITNGKSSYTNNGSLDQTANTTDDKDDKPASVKEVRSTDEDTLDKTFATTSDPLVRTIQDSDIIDNSSHMSSGAITGTSPSKMQDSNALDDSLDDITNNTEKILENKISPDDTHDTTSIITNKAFINEVKDSDDIDKTLQQTCISDYASACTVKDNDIPDDSFRKSEITERALTNGIQYSTDPDDSLDETANTTNETIERITSDVIFEKASATINEALDNTIDNGNVVDCSNEQISHSTNNTLTDNVDNNDIPGKDSVKKPDSTNKEFTDRVIGVSVLDDSLDEYFDTIDEVLTNIVQIGNVGDETTDKILKAVNETVTYSTQDRDDLDDSLEQHYDIANETNEVDDNVTDDSLEEITNTGGMSHVHNYNRFMTDDLASIDQIDIDKAYAYLDLNDRYASVIRSVILQDDLYNSHADNISYIMNDALQFADISLNEMACNSEDNWYTHDASDPYCSITSNKTETAEDGNSFDKCKNLESILWDVPPKELFQPFHYLPYELRTTNYKATASTSIREEIIEAITCNKNRTNELFQKSYVDDICRPKGEPQVNSDYHNPFDLISDIVHKITKIPVKYLHLDSSGSTDMKTSTNIGTLANIEDYLSNTSVNNNASDSAIAPMFNDENDDEVPVEYLHDANGSNGTITYLVNKSTLELVNAVDGLLQQLSIPYENSLIEGGKERKISYKGTVLSANLGNSYVNTNNLQDAVKYTDADSDDDKAGMEDHVNSDSDNESINIVDYKTRFYDLLWQMKDIEKSHDMELNEYYNLLEAYDKEKQRTKAICPQQELMGSLQIEFDNLHNEYNHSKQKIGKLQEKLTEKERLLLVIDDELSQLKSEFDMLIRSLGKANGSPCACQLPEIMQQYLAGKNIAPKREVYDIINSSDGFISVADDSPRGITRNNSNISSHIYHSSPSSVDYLSDNTRSPLDTVDDIDDQSSTPSEYEIKRLADVNNKTSIDGSIHVANDSPTGTARNNPNVTSHIYNPSSIDYLSDNSMSLLDTVDDVDDEFSTDSEYDTKRLVGVNNKMSTSNLGAAPNNGLVKEMIDASTNTEDVTDDNDITESSISDVPTPITVTFLKSPRETYDVSGNYGYVTRCDVATNTMMTGISSDLLLTTRSLQSCDELETFRSAILTELTGLKNLCNCGDVRCNETINRDTLIHSKKDLCNVLLSEDGEINDGINAMFSDMFDVSSYIFSNTSRDTLRSHNSWSYVQQTSQSAGGVTRSQRSSVSGMDITGKDEQLIYLKNYLRKRKNSIDKELWSTAQDILNCSDDQCPQVDVDSISQHELFDKLFQHISDQDSISVNDLEKYQGMLNIVRSDHTITVFLQALVNKDKYRMSASINCDLKENLSSEPEEEYTNGIYIGPQKVTPTIILETNKSDSSESGISSLSDIKKQLITSESDSDSEQYANKSIFGRLLCMPLKSRKSKRRSKKRKKTYL